MSQFEVADKHALILGQAILETAVHLQHLQEFLRGLRINDLDDIAPDGWYPLQSWLNVFKHISEHADGKYNLVAVGMAIGKGVYVPSHVNNIETVLESFDDIYQAVLQGQVGHYHITRIAPRHYQIVAAIPYPDDLIYGTIYGFCRRFEPPDSSLTVSRDETAPSLLRGDDSTTYLVTW